MTTITIPLNDAVARSLEERSREAGKTPEEYAREVLSRVAALSPLQALAERNAQRLREAGYESEADVDKAIQEGIEDVRRAR